MFQQRKAVVFHYDLFLASQGGCYCDNTSPECHDSQTFGKQVADNDACCGQRVTYYNYYYYYIQSPQEQSGTCYRRNSIPPGQFVPISSVPSIIGKLYAFF